MVIEIQNKDGFIDPMQASDAIKEFFSQHDCSGKNILLIIPDNTRSGPIGDIFQIIFDCLDKKVKALDCLVALGTLAELRKSAESSDRLEDIFLRLTGES